MHQKLEEFLASKGARWHLVRHLSAVTAQDQAGASHTPGQSMAKVVIVKERDGLAMAVVPASSVLDLDRLAGVIGHGDIRIATVEEIQERVPDCMPGAIPPFGQLFGIATFADRAILAPRDITMPAGDLVTSIRMRSQEYRRLALPRIGDFAVAEALVAAGAVVRKPRPWRRAS